MTREDLISPPEILINTKQLTNPKLHDIFIDTSDDGYPVLRLMHKGFLNYQVNFRSRKEIDSYISKLEKFRDKAFPTNKSVEITP